MLKRVLSLGFAVLAVGSSAFAGTEEKNPIAPPAPAMYDPLDHWEFDLESGALWRFEHNGTPLNYVFLPQMLTIKTPAVLRHDFKGGSSIAIRSRFSILLESIIEGPESYFFGVSGSGILEWWNAPRTFSLFFSSGGGVGWLDSKGYEVEGGQGQDFNFNWFVYTGARVMVAEKVSVGLGAYYQHISNKDQDKVNPGVDALGPMLSIGWHF